MERKIQINTPSTVWIEMKFKINTLFPRHSRKMPYKSSCAIITGVTAVVIKHVSSKDVHDH